MIDMDKLRLLAEAAYNGLSLKECFTYAQVFTMDEYLADQAVRNVMRYARTKAKFDLLARAQDIALNESHAGTSQMLRYLLSAKFAFSENSAELKDKRKQHKDLMEHRKDTLRQWADYQSAKMVLDATHDQLTRLSEQPMEVQNE